MTDIDDVGEMPVSPSDAAPGSAKEPEIVAREFEHTPDDQSTGIGRRLRQWRIEEELSLSEVGQCAELSASYVSQIERGRANPSLASLKRLTNAVEKRVGDLFDDDERRGGSSNEQGFIQVVRAEERKRILYPGSQIINKLISPDVQHRLEVLWIEAPVGAVTGRDAHTHAGEECGLILAGSMELWVGDQDWVLYPGDSIYLESGLPHRWRSAGPVQLEAIWAVTPPSF